MTTIPDPRRIETLSRSHMIECIMAMVGRGLADAPKYRRWLEAQSDRTLSEHLEIIMNGEDE